MTKWMESGQNRKSVLLFCRDDSNLCLLCSPHHSDTVCNTGRERERNVVKRRALASRKQVTHSLSLTVVVVVAVVAVTPQKETETRGRERAVDEDDGRGRRSDSISHLLWYS